MLSNVLTWTHAHAFEILMLWPLITAIVSLFYKKLDSYPRVHAVLSSLVAAGLDLPKLLDALKRVLTGAPSSGPDPNGGLAKLLAFILAVTVAPTLLSACAGAPQPTTAQHLDNVADSTAYGLELVACRDKATHPTYADYEKCAEVADAKHGKTDGGAK